MPRKSEKYSKDFLQELLQKDNASLNPDETLPEYLNRDIEIPFRCSCGKRDKKGFRYIEKSGALCHSCTYKKGLEQREETNLQRYNTKNQSNRQEIIEQRKETNLERRGVTAPGKCPLVKQKSKETSQRNWGTDHPMQSPTVRQQVEETNMAERGVKCVLQAPEIIEQIRETNLEKYGAANPFASPEIKEKIKQINIATLGVPYPGQSDKVKQKSKETSQRNWGTDHPMQHPDVADKCLARATSQKEYKMPSSEIRVVQGYEPFALDELLLEGYTENNIITGTKNVTTIIWKDADGKSHTHYPDIEIADVKHLIEVKSTYLYKRDKYKILAKMAAATDDGYKYEIRVYTQKGKRIYLDSEYNLCESNEELSSEDDNISRGTLSE